MNRYFIKYISLVISPVLLSANLIAQQIISEKNDKGFFALNNAVTKTRIYVDPNDFAVVNKCASFLQKDIEMATGEKPQLTNKISSAATCIIIGTIERSSFIQQLIQRKKIDAAKIKDKWEAYLVQSVSDPFPGIKKALVIAGSDRRGTAYGVFELSKQIGVSPWYWWADVPVKKKNALYVKDNVFVADAPKVKYRGIFINDEAPALSGWTKEKFGGFNHLFYEKVFELILRLKGNYLWPAMWGNAFYDDDSVNIKSADAYGIVIGTSHHEPLMRAHVEWKRYGNGPWNYDSNELRLKDFWRKGMERATNEKIVSVGMRGDGDEPMTRETATALLERIVKDQRQIIEQVTRKPASATPQLWALYKEVQDYYDKGMRVPDDVTLLLCDDNWGNIRRLPSLHEKPRKGGYGIYYHFDYVGDPRNYKWINTNNIARVWEQMHLAWEYNVRQIWIVNVGDIKPMEYPISFFLDYAWNPEKINAGDLTPYAENWAAAQFGNKYAVDIADLIAKYSCYNAQRKPELLDDSTYSFNYDELKRVTEDYTTLEKQAEEINRLILPEYRNAYFQLVLHPVKAGANLHRLYESVAWNHFFANENNVYANEQADRAKQLFINDSLLSVQYHTVSNGKWNHLMDQTHIGYTYWQQPPQNAIPQLFYISPGKKPEATFIDEPVKSAERMIPDTGKKKNTFFEFDGYVSIQAQHYTKATNIGSLKWTTIPCIGKTGSGVTTFPVTVSPGTFEKSALLEYELYTYDSGTVKINAYFSPTLNLHNTDGLKYFITIDDEPPQVISINRDDNDKKTWEKWVADNIIIKTTEHNFSKPGRHSIKYGVADAGIILQKLVIDCGGLKPSYLGPPETIKQDTNKR